jgi:hypothetical protein
VQRSSVCCNAPGAPLRRCEERRATSGASALKTDREIEAARELGDGKVLFGRAHCGGEATLYRVVSSD